MKKVEKHLIKSSHEWFEYCQEVTTYSRQLFNSAQYSQRQSFFYGWGTLNLSELDIKFKQHESYKALPAKVAQLVLKQLADTWLSYFQALKAYKKDSSAFTGRPRVPKYSEKYNLVKFNNQAISKTEFKKGFVCPSKSPIKIPVKPKLKFEDLCEVRIVPKVGCFVIEVVYEKAEQVSLVNCHSSAASIDIGLDNLATITYSKYPKFLIINGKTLKSKNQFYNKQIARYRGLLSRGQETSRRIQNIVINRNNFV